MDAFIPFVQRTPGTLVSPEPTMVVPIFKDARIRPAQAHEQKFLIYHRKKGKSQAHTEAYPDAPYTTPEDEQHADKNGHVDIFI